jgi:hypothetical protein
MLKFKRDDGTTCEALQFMGSNEDVMENRFEVLDILIKADLMPVWVAEAESEEWVENEEGDDYIHPIIPEHILVGASKDEVKVGDYIVIRDGDTYVQDGQIFESVWEMVSAGYETVGPVKKADVCKNCGRNIANFDIHGNVFDVFYHTSGEYKSFNGCAPHDVNDAYTYHAEPRTGNTPKEITE